MLTQGVNTPRILHLCPTHWDVWVTVLYVCLQWWVGVQSCPPPPFSILWFEQAPMLCLSAYHKVTMCAVV